MQAAPCGAAEPNLEVHSKPGRARPGQRANFPSDGASCTDLRPKPTSAKVIPTRFGAPPPPSDFWAIPPTPRSTLPPPPQKCPRHEPYSVTCSIDASCVSGGATQAKLDPEHLACWEAVTSLCETCMYCPSQPPVCNRYCLLCGMHTGATTGEKRCTKRGNRPRQSRGSAPIPRNRNSKATSTTQGLLGDGIGPMGRSAQPAQPLKQTQQDMGPNQRCSAAGMPSRINSTMASGGRPVHVLVLASGWPERKSESNHGGGPTPAQLRRNTSSAGGKQQFSFCWPSCAACV